MSEQEETVLTGIDAEIAEEEKPVEEELEEEETAASEEEDQEPEKKERTPGYIKRINKLTADKYEERKRADDLQRQIDEMKKGGQSKPTLEEFDYDEDAYNQAIIDQRVREAAAKAVAENMRQIEQEKAKRSFEDKVNRFVDKVRKANIETYEEDVTNLIDNVQLPMDVIEAIHEDDKGPEIMAYLGRNLDIADELTSLSPVQAGRKLSEISMKFTAKPKKKITKAPDPIKPSSSGGTAPGS